MAKAYSNNKKKGMAESSSSSFSLPVGYTELPQAETKPGEAPGDDAAPADDEPRRRRRRPSPSRRSFRRRPSREPRRTPQIWVRGLRWVRGSDWVERGGHDVGHSDWARRWTGRLGGGRWTGWAVDWLV